MIRVNYVSLSTSCVKVLLVVGGVAFGRVLGGFESRSFARGSGNARFRQLVHS